MNMAMGQDRIRLCFQDLKEPAMWGLSIPFEQDKE